MNAAHPLFAHYAPLVERAVLAASDVERETALAEAFQLGRALVQHELSAVDLVAQHQAALESLARRHPCMAYGQVAGRLLVPLLELTAAHSMAHAELLQRRQDGELQAHAEQAARLESLGVLAAGMAHDFNTLLGSIMCYTDMAGDLMPAAGSDYLQQIRLACERASQLVRRMLDFAGQRGGMPQPQPVAHMVNEALALVRPSLGPRIALTFDNQLPQACVLAEAGMLQQIVINLCINAGEAMPDGGRLQLALHAAAERSGQLELVVADNGCGMPPEVQERMFEPFFTTRAPRGSGLGLSVVYGLMRRLQGEIVVHSRCSGADTGTAFHLYLPIAAEPQAEECQHGPYSDR